MTSQEMDMATCFRRKRNLCYRMIYEMFSHRDEAKEKYEIYTRDQRKYE